jgi:excisionase family DNA binding protein
MVDRLSTLTEIAEQLQMSERKLRRIIRQRDIPVLEAGRDIRFDAEAVIALKEALRRPCRSGSIDAKTARTGRSTSRLMGSAYEQALKLATEGSRGKRQRPSKPNSSDPLGTANVVALDHSPKRS